MEYRKRGRLQLPITLLLPLRDIGQHRARSLLSGLAGLLGVALTIMADVVGRSLLAGMTQTEDLAAITKGLTDQLATWMLLAGVAVTFAAGFMIFNAFMMSVTQRRQQIGALRSLGMNRRQVRRLILFEALIIGGLATLLGLIVGPLAARGILTLIDVVDFQMFPFIPVPPSLPTLVLALVLGIGISLMSVTIPARRATRISPLEALRQPRVETPDRSRTARPTLAGLVLAVVVMAFLIVAPPGRWARAPLNLAFTAMCSLVWLVSAGLMLPALVGGAAHLARAALAGAWPAGGRLVADNLGRDRSRVTLTIVGLALGVALVVAMTGFFHFFYDEFFGGFIEGRASLVKYEITAFDLDGEVGSYAAQESLILAPEVREAVYAVAEGRAAIVENTFVIVPELSVLGDSFFSMMIPARQMADQARVLSDSMFTFSQGSWEEAVPIMEDGCGVLIIPAIAERYGVGLYDGLTLTGTNGPVDCTVAGLGQSDFAGASIVGAAAAPALGVSTPMDLSIVPLPGADVVALQDDLQALVDRFENAYLTTSGSQAETIGQFNSTVLLAMNSMLLIAIAAAALGIINTTVMSIAERRREIGLLRAVGALRRQVQRMMAGEAALMGVIGALAGVVAGAGLIVIFATTYGGSAFGVELDLWAAGGRNVVKALPVGAFALIAAPLVAAGAAWLPTHAVVRGTSLETID